jgi:DNA-binding PadR family transcriptional regulator
MEGIVEWWLLEQRIRCAIADVETALNNLVKNDFLITHQRADGRISYELNREKEREIRRHLREAQATNSMSDTERGRIQNT